MSSVDQAWKFVADRKVAICDGPVPRELDAVETLRQLLSGTDLPDDDVKRYVDAASGFVIQAAMRGMPLTGLLPGIIADAFITGYHARRFEPQAGE